MTDPLSPEEIAEMRQLLEQATPGRWHKYQTGIGEFICGVAPGRGNAVYADTPGGTRPSADLSLIVAAHSAMPLLLSIAEDHARLVERYDDHTLIHPNNLRELITAKAELSELRAEANQYHDCPGCSFCTVEPRPLDALRAENTQLRERVEKLETLRKAVVNHRCRHGIDLSSALAACKEDSK